jgi:hypothetical protein
MTTAQKRRAVILRNRRSHWVYDAFYTYCGRRLVELSVDRELPCDELPGDPCPTCLSVAEGTAEHSRERVTLPPSTGTLRRTGPLYHGPAPKGHGQRL